MSSEFFISRTSQFVKPVGLPGKDQYLVDLMNIEHSWTGRADVLFANTFFQEAIQLVINSINLFEMGYFDCAFYSLRQSLEVCTTVVYFVDDEEQNRKAKIAKWKREERFPMNNQMIEELKKRKNVFADLKEKMKLYFEELEEIKQRLNKYVHKQGFDKFYVQVNHALKKKNYEGKIMSDFSEFLVKSIGAIAVFRLAIDPLPVLLADDEIYKRTGQLMTESYSEEFMAKYIGIEHLKSYKFTEVYQGHYNELITQEAMTDGVLAVVKDNFVDRTKFEEIIKQAHLLDQHSRVAVTLFSVSAEIAKVYCMEGWHWYFSDVISSRSSLAYSSADFDIFKTDNPRFNNPYGEAYLSAVKIWQEDYFLEHNKPFTEVELDYFNSLSRKFADPPTFNLG